MKLAVYTAALATMALAGLGAQSPARALTSQQELMKTCNTTAGTQHLTGDARKTFMSDCLSGRTAAPAAPATPMTPQQRMTSCNATAGTQHLAGDARKTFMASCLKAS
jgi:hypothetical protein